MKQKRCSGLPRIGGVHIGDILVALDAVPKDKDPPVLQDDLHLKQRNVFLHVACQLHEGEIHVCSLWVPRDVELAVGLRLAPKVQLLDATVPANFIGLIQFNGKWNAFNYVRLVKDNVK
jgi:hypothetical protein